MKKADNIDRIFNTVKTVEGMGGEYIIEGVNHMIDINTNPIDFTLRDDFFPYLMERYNKTERGIEAAILRTLSIVRSQKQFIKIFNVKKVTLKKILSYIIINNK